MSCAVPRDLVQAHLDRELDLVHSLEMEEHLRTCAVCADAYRAGRGVRAAITARPLAYPAPAALRARVREAIPREAKSDPSPRVPWWGWRPLAVSFATAMLAVLIVPYLVGPRAQDAQLDEIVSGHVRSLMASHLTDVPSSDKHTVKPWFDGKLDFSPPVVDLADHGFPLTGGRLDYLSGRTVAALVYMRQKHFINLFVSPAEASAPRALQTISRRGFNVALWTSGGMTFQAVSDLNAGELSEFVDLVRQRAVPPPS